MEIREVLPQEHTETGDVVALAYQEYGDPDDAEWNQHLELVRRVADRLQRTVVLVAVEGGRVLGSATIELFDVIGDDDHDLPPDVAILRMLGVHPEARRRGIARGLVQEVIRRARAAGKSELWLRTTPGMVPAHRLYESIGFRRDESLDMSTDSGGALPGYRLRL